MAIKVIPAPKPVKASGFLLPKISMARPMSASASARSSASGYGMLGKLATPKKGVIPQL
jgi:hypothetical protein